MNSFEESPVPSRMKKVQNWAIGWAPKEEQSGAFKVVGSELGGPEERNHEVGFLL